MYVTVPTHVCRHIKIAKAKARYECMKNWTYSLHRVIAKTDCNTISGRCETVGHSVQGQLQQIDLEAYQ